MDDLEIEEIDCSIKPACEQFLVICLAGFGRRGAVACGCSSSVTILGVG
jgi:hypothetical protein